MMNLSALVLITTVLASTLVEKVQGQAAVLPVVIFSESTLTQFSQLAAQTGLDVILTAAGPYTVFAPNDDAFATLDSKFLEPEWSEHLTEIMYTHVAEGLSYTTGQWEVGAIVTAFSEMDVTVTSVDPTFQINNVSNVVRPDILANNGVLHIMDTVLLPPDIVGLLNVAESQVSALLGLLDQTGLIDDLQGDGPFTLLAPSNAAFEALGADELATLQSDIEALSSILLFHVLPGVHITDNLEADGVTSLPTLQGEDMMIPFENFLLDDFLASNGVVRIIDEVQFPSELRTSPPGGNDTLASNATNDFATDTEVPGNSTTEAPGDTASMNTTSNITESTTNNIIDVALALDFTTMVSAFNQTDWFERLQGEENFTLFGVPNDGFGTMPSQYISDPQWNKHLLNVLTYHILPGNVFLVNFTEGATYATLGTTPIAVSNADPFQIDGINVTDADIIADNGVVHVVESVLLPPSARDTAYDLVSQFPQFTTLFGLLEAANLTDALQGEGPITLAAPVNQAFDALPEGSLESLQADPDALQEVLLYHVIPELANFGDLAGISSTFPTAQGSQVTFTPGVATNKINDADVQFADLLVRNGYLHVIDQVLMPPNENQTIAPTATTTEESSLVPIGTYDDLFWAELPLEIQAAASILGFNETSWNEGLLVETSDLLWQELTPEQQQAAAIFGYNQELWDTETLAPTGTLSPTENATEEVVETASPTEVGVTMAPTAATTAGTVTPTTTTMAGTVTPTAATTTGTVSPTTTATTAGTATTTIATTAGTVTPTTATTAGTVTPTTATTAGTVVPSQITPDETQTIAPTTTTTEESSLVPIGTYDDLFWAELPLEIQAAASILGFNETSWNEGLLVETSDLLWQELTPEQQQAAAIFGYNQELWDAETLAPTGTLSPTENATEEVVAATASPTEAGVTLAPTAGTVTPTIANTMAPTVPDMVSTVATTMAPTLSEVETVVPTTPPVDETTTAPTIGALLTSSPTVVPTPTPVDETTAAPTVGGLLTSAPTEADVIETGPPVITVAPTENCVNIPGVQVCCPPGQTDGVFFFCRFL